MPFSSGRACPPRFARLPNGRALRPKAGYPEPPCSGWATPVHHRHSPTPRTHCAAGRGAGPQNGRARKVALEARFIQRQQLEQVRLGQIRACVRFHQLSFAGKAVPGADLQTIVAAENAVADRRSQLRGNAASQLDGQIGNAATRIELERGGDRRGRAGRDTARAGAAVVGLRRIGFEFKGGDDLGQEEPVAESAADQVGVLADESQPGALPQSRAPAAARCPRTTASACPVRPVRSGIAQAASRRSPSTSW